MPNDKQNNSQSPFPQDDSSLGMHTVSGDTQAAAPSFGKLPDPPAVNNGSNFQNPSLPAEPVAGTSDSSILNPLSASAAPTDSVVTQTITDNGNGSVSSVTNSDSPHVPKKYGGKKVIATIFSVLFIVGAVFAGVRLVQQQQLFQQEAASGSACDQSPDCDLVDNAPNSGSKTVSRTIIYVDITDQDYHRFNPGSTDDGCRKVNISGNSVTWERYGSGPDCKDVSNVQIWMGNTPTATATPSPSPTPPVTTNTPTPTGTTSNAVSCPAGTTSLFATAGTLNVGSSVSLGGSVSSKEGSWNTDQKNGVLLANGPTSGSGKITVNFPTNVLLESVLIYDNDPKSGESAWTINGTSLPTTGDGKWGPLYNLNKTSNQMVFDNGGDSPHFNVCVKTASSTSTPTVSPPPGITAQCNSVKAYDLAGNLLTSSQLSQLDPGTKIRFAVSGTTSSGSFSKARFSVNNTSLGESTTKNTQGEFYIEYTIPQNVTSFSVKGEVNHSSLGWI